MVDDTLKARISRTEMLSMTMIWRMKSSMADYYEIDFLAVGTKGSGDAICIRYELNGEVYVHVVDGGYVDTGRKVVDHLETYYGDKSINHVVITHPDGDHANGLRTVLQECEVGKLWMNRPWEYADLLVERFSRYTNVENLRKRLREVFPNLAALEDIAIERGIPIAEGFQGQHIGAFKVLGPTLNTFLDNVVECERTPTAASKQTLAEQILEKLVDTVTLVKSAWGEEVFPDGDTQPRNAMSIVQYARLAEDDILLTGDTGRAGLDEAADYAPYVGLDLPGIDKFHVPHHGSRRNVSTATLDRWLGPRQPEGQRPISTAIISASENDIKHPRKVVVRALKHRGARVISTEGKSIRTKGGDAPKREGWVAVTELEYPTSQEEA